MDYAASKFYTRFAGLVYLESDWGHPGYRERGEGDTLSSSPWPGFEWTRHTNGLISCYVGEHELPAYHEGKD